MAAAACVLVVAGAATTELAGREVAGLAERAKDALVRVGVEGSEEDALVVVVVVVVARRPASPLASVVGLSETPLSLSKGG